MSAVSGSGRSVLAISEQGMGAALNFLALVAVARSASVRELGAFALAWSVHSFVIFGWDYWFGPSVILHMQRSSQHAVARAEARSYASKQILWLFPAASLLYFVCLGEIGASLALALVTCAWVMLTSLRYMNHAGGGGFSYLVLMLVYGLIFVVPLIWVDFRFDAWQAPIYCQAISSLLVLIVLLRIRPGKTRGGSRNFNSVATMDRGSLGNLATQVAMQIGAPLLMYLMSGPAALAGYRGARSVVAPFLQLPQGLQPVLVRRLSQADQTNRVLLKWTAFNVALLGIAGVSLNFVPSAVGEGLLGVSWSVAAPCLMWVTFAAAGNQSAFAMEFVIRSHGKVRGLLGLRLILLAPSLVAIGAGAYWWGAVGASVAAFAVSSGTAVAVAGMMTQFGLWTSASAHVERGIGDAVIARARKGRP